MIRAKHDTSIPLIIMNERNLKRVFSDPLQEERRKFIFNNLQDDLEAFLEGSEDYTYEQLRNILNDSYKLARLFKEMFRLRPDELILYNTVRRELN